MCLPADPGGVYHILSQLHDIGVLLLLGDHTKGDCHVVLKGSTLISEVHKLLFCKSAIDNLQKNFRDLHDANFNIGIIPECVLKEILPPYITTQCLTCLQYCQEISCEEIAMFISATRTNQSFFFFPALCSKDRSDIAWVTPSNFSYSIGWLARCMESCEFFPPRFLHVLLLRLVFRFTLSAHQDTGASLGHNQLQRRCTMWKTGVHWLMTQGVECMVELVNSSKEVVVVVKSTNKLAQNCLSIFNRVVSCVMEAKAEFCYSIRPGFFLFDSKTYNDANSLTRDNLFAMYDVEKALAHPDGNDAIVSVSGKGIMERSRLDCMRTFTLWNSIFPFAFTDILDHLKNIVKDLYQLGVHFGICQGILDAIEHDFHSDTGRRRRELVRAWLSSNLDPCWWHLVRVLEGIHERVLAKEIKRKHSE